MARTDTYEKARPYIAEHVVNHGKLPTVDALAYWFSNEHGSTPSRETLRRVLLEFRTPAGESSPADASALSLAQTTLAQARKEANAEADKKLAIARETIERDANKRIAEAERAAAVRAEGAELDRVEAEGKAARAEERAKVLAEQSQRALADTGARNETLTNALLAASQRISELIYERETALRHAAEAIARMRSIESAHEACVKALQVQLVDLTRNSDEREARSAEQFRLLSHSSSMEISRQRDKIAELEKALLAARVEKDQAVSQTRRDISDAIATQLKELAGAVGGVNQVHNTHMGGLREQLEETMRKLDLVSASLDRVVPAAKVALPQPNGKNGHT